jgi:hypothetical protein
MINKNAIVEGLERALADGASIKEMLMNPDSFADTYGIVNKAAFVKGVNDASTFVPEETYHLFEKNPFVTDETRKLFNNLESSNLDNSKTLPVTVATLTLALTAAVVAAKLVKK